MTAVLAFVGLVLLWRCMILENRLRRERDRADWYRRAR